MTVSLLWPNLYRAEMPKSEIVENKVMDITSVAQAFNLAS